MFCPGFMAGATTASQIFENHNISSSSNTDHEISKQEIQAAIAKVVELRALHAALMQGNSLTNVRFPSPFPASLPGTQFSAKDYPVFTPTVSINLINLVHKFFFSCRLHLVWLIYFGISFLF